MKHTMQILVLAVVVALFMVACSDAGKKQANLNVDGKLGDYSAADARTVPDPDLVVDDKTAEPDRNVDPPDLSIGEDLPDSTEPDEAGQDVTMEDIQALDLHYQLDPELVGELCFDFCQKTVECEFTDQFGPQYECQVDCEDALMGSPELISNYFCVAEMDECYMFDVCWDPQPLPTYPGCGDWCELVLDCDFAGMMDVPDDFSLCVAACTGSLTPWGAMAKPSLDCALAALEDDCDIFALQDCFGDPTDCEAKCGELADECEPDTEFFELYPDDEACAEVCEEYSGEQFFAQDVCITIAGCDSAFLCESIPAEPIVGCKEFCVAFKEVCEDTGLTQQLCEWACTASALAIPDSDPLGAVDCVLEIEDCPQEPFYLLVGCISGECSTMCGMAEQCAPGTEYFNLYPSDDDCQVACEAMNESQVAATGVCLSGAGCDGALLCQEAPLEPPEGCDEYCVELADLCPTLPLPATLECEDFCSGMTMMSPAADPSGAKECFEQFEECPEDLNDALWTCLAGKCGFMCGYFDQCAPSSEYVQMYGTKEGCEDACMELTYDGAQVLGICHAFASCDGAPACVDPPAEPPEGCDGYCDSLLDVCPNILDDYGTIPCENVCSGIVMAVPGANPEGAPECLDEYEFCPVEEEAAMYGCLIEPSPECDEVCGILDQCDIVASWECSIFCASVQETAPFQFTMLQLCITGANGDCAEVAVCVGD